MSETVRFRLDIAYDGGGFTGWAVQPGHRTVQGVLEDAIATLFSRVGHAPRLSVAGRTDAGVHASGQVAHIDLLPEHIASLRSRRGRADIEIGENLAARVNGVLGSNTDTVITSATVADPGFDARFSALWRRYEYRIADASSPRDPLQRHRTVWNRAHLDIDAMRHASAALLGLNDFTAFCRARPGATAIRTLQEFSWARNAEGVLVASLQADAFCHSMVRSLIGGTVAVGEGSLTPDAFVGMLGAERRSEVIVVQPARGLTLTEVAYPSADRLAARARLTRAQRVTTQVAAEDDDG